MAEKFKIILRNYNILIFIVLIQFLQIFYLNTNITNYDGAQYSLAAKNWAENGINLKSEVFYTYTNYGSLTEHRFNSSFLAILPLAFFIKIFGYSLLSVQIFAVLCSIFVILLLKLYVQKLFDKKTSDYAIGLYALFPVNAYLSGSYLTDSYSNLLILTILITFYYGFHKYTLFNYFLIIFSGLLTVLSTFVRQWLPVIFIINLLFFYFYYKKFDVRILYYIAGNFLGLISIFIIAHVFTGDYFYFFNVYKEYGAEISKNHFLENPLFILPLLCHVDYYSVLFLILPFAAIKIVFDKNKKELFFFVWIIFLYLFFEILIRVFINLPRYHGYLNILIIPAVIILVIAINKVNIQKQVSKFIAVLLFIFVILMIIFKNIDYSYINYFYYSHLLNIRKYYLILSVIISVIILLYFAFKFRKNLALFFKPVLLFQLILILLNLSIFSLHIMLSRSYETSVMIKSVEVIGEKEVLFYNLKNSIEPYKIQCTNPTLLIPYYQQLLYGNKKMNYEIKIINDISGFNKNGYFLFADKISSINPWKVECFDELSNLQKILLTNQIPVTKYYDFGNYTLWRIR